MISRHCVRYHRRVVFQIPFENTDMRTASGREAPALFGFSDLSARRLAVVISRSNQRNARFLGSAVSQVFFSTSSRARLVAAGQGRHDDLLVAASAR